jgi:transposase IS116/IS110/IS902 family protein
MESVKYLGFDVHQSTISVAVVNADGKLVMRSVIATHAATILDFIQGLRGTLHLTFEEGTHSAWLYDLLARRVARVLVCNPRQNTLLKAGKRELVLESRKHAAAKLLRTVPLLGAIRAALLIGRVQTPHRFRSKRQFWAYCGLALETRSSADYRFEDGQLVRAKKPVFIRGLNRNHNHDLKNLFKSAATTASVIHGPFRAIGLGVGKAY